MNLAVHAVFGLPIILRLSPICLSLRLIAAGIKDQSVLTPKVCSCSIVGLLTTCQNK